MSKQSIIQNGEEILLTAMQYYCPVCGEIYEQGWVRADSYPVQTGWLCPKCRKTIPHVGNIETLAHPDGKKTVLTKRVYDKCVDGTKYPYTEINVYCEVCKCFLCIHVYQEGFEWKLVKGGVAEK